MTTSFVEQAVQRALEFEAGRAAGSLVTRTPLPDSPFKNKQRPTPSGFEQTPLPTYTRRSTGTTAGQLDVQEQGEGGDGSRGQGYSFFEGSRRGTGYDYSFDIEPIIGGPKARMGVPTPVEPKFGKSYIGYLADEKFGAKKYYDPVTGTIKSGFPGALKQALPSPIGFFAGIGGSISQANLERIAAAARIDKDGYAVATLGGRTIGVSPSPFGGYVLSGVLPQGITDLQRRQIKDKLLEISKTDAASGAYTPEGTGTPQSGSDPSDPAFAGDGQYYSGVGPSPQEGGSAGDPGYIPTPPSDYQREPGGGGHPSGTPNDPSPEPSPSPSRSEPSGPSGYGRDSSGNQRSDPSGYGGFGGRRASGGPVGFAEGGNTQKDPIQRTGFVEGPPQEYAKGTTVADTENLRVREGSFVINAPMTEKLQKAGVLPKGNQKRKASKGGKMMEVALSKGEYVVEPKDVSKFGGYGFLETVNDMGKPEVERRQAMRNGGEAGIDVPPLSKGFAQRPASRSVPEGFLQQQKVDPGPIPPVQINNINLQNVGKALELVETRGFENLNEGYFYTKSDTPKDPSSAFGPLQITDETVLAMIDEFDDLRIQMKLNPEFAQYITEYNIAGRNRVNMREHKKIYEGERGKKSVARKPTPEEAIIYKNLGTGPISVERHKEHYPLLAELYLRYKAGMSDSEEDLVRRHFGNNKSLKKFRNAKKELGID